MADERPQPRGGAVIDSRGAMSVALGSGFAGASGLVVTLLAAYTFTLAQNAEFLAFWSALFACYAVLTGIQQELVRATATVVLEPHRAQSRTLPVALGVGAAVAVLAMATWPWWHATLMPGRSMTTAVVACASLVLYAGHLAVTGTLMGRRQWHQSSALTAGEAAVRLTLVGVALVVAAGLDAVEVAVVASSALWMVALAVPSVRGAAAARADVATGALVRRIVQAMAAAVGTAVLVTGFPAVMRATTDAATWEDSAPLVLAITLTRAALLMPLQAFQGAAVSYFLDPLRPRSASLVRLTGLVLAGTAVLATFAGLIGPWLLGLLGPDYVVSAWLLVALTSAGGLMGLLTLYGSVTLALSRHGVYATGWLTAAVVACGVLLIGLRLDVGALVALVVGPLAGMTVHLVAIRRTLRRGTLGLGATGTA